MQTPPTNRDIYSVSRLNSEVRAVLEGSFPLLWVEGEISNLARPASGHVYFSLKDRHAQVRCALFRNRRMHLRFAPENGAQVLVRARISLYEGRGEFQLIVEQLEPAGEGALQRAFDELKARLDREGLFAAEHKRSLPPYPRCIGLITSPSGAAIRDVLSVLRRRWPLARVMIYPSAVQGEDAPAQLCHALRLAEQRAECDLLILTRGGGSLEDLAAFNDETLARAIHAARIPLISAVGHEIDFTIADFVADRRAPTPSVAAELATPDQAELTTRIMRLERRLQAAMRARLREARHAWHLLAGRLRARHPASWLRQLIQRLDELEQRLRRAMPQRLAREEHRLARLRERLWRHSPASALTAHRQRLGYLRRRLADAMRHDLEQRRHLARLRGQALHMVSPLRTLERGYAIVTRDTDGRVLSDARQARVGEPITARLARGRLHARIEEIEPPDEQA